MNEQRIAALRVAQGYHILPIKPGMQLELHEHVGEGSNKRIWRFKGLVIKVKKKNHADGTFTIRGKVAGNTIEKIYPLSFPNFAKVLLLDHYKIRRAKLYYIRDKVGKDAKMDSLLTNADKGVDLLKLAKEEIDALHAAYLESMPKEGSEEASAEASAEASTDAPADAPTDAPAEPEATDEGKAEVAPTKEAPTQEAPAEEPKAEESSEEKTEEKS